MKKLFRIMAGMTLGLLSFTSLEAYSQSDEYPNFYLRGTKNQWGCEQQYKFTRAGARYYLYFSNYSGEAKISNEDWTIEYGAVSGSETTVNTFKEYDGIIRGDNWILDFPENIDVTVSFVYNKQEPNTAKITFYEGKIEFTDEPDPTPDPVNLTSGTLPVLYINVYTDATNTTLNNEIIDKDLSHKNYFTNAEYWLEMNGCTWMEGSDVGSKDAPLPLQIKARGNYTRTGFAKKPFKLKLDKKQNLLGMTPEKSKHYAILAHADDTRGYLRNFTGFNLGKRIGLPWTPSQQPVEVIINGDYRGVYFLTESIRVGDGRVPITELEDNESDPYLISGGYLVELDNYDEEENQIRFEEKPGNNGDPTVRVTFDTPEEYSEIQYRFINDQFTEINNLVGERSKDLWSYLDMDDLARYYLVEEILGHTESFHGSTYLYRDRGEGQKWHFSPLWDCGNAFNSYNDQFFFNTPAFGNTWIHTIAFMPEFRSKVEETWKWFMSTGFNGIYDDMKEYTDRLKKAAEYDYKRWNNAPRPNSMVSSPVADNRDIEHKYNDVKNYLETRVNWLKGQFGDYSGYFAEPSRDTTPAAKLPSYILTDVEVIEVVAPGSEENTAYYTLEGVKVERPVKGIYIKVSGNTVNKIVIP